MKEFIIEGKSALEIEKIKTPEDFIAYERNPEIGEDVLTRIVAEGYKYITFSGRFKVDIEAYEMAFLKEQYENGNKDFVTDYATRHYPEKNVKEFIFDLLTIDYKPFIDLSK